MKTRLAGLALISACFLALPAPAQRPTYDLLIRGGDLYYGSGSASARGDVGIKGDRIVCVGACPDE